MGACGGISDTSLATEGQEHVQTDFGALTKYDVFLNHRGPDLKKTFVSHLNKALCQAGCAPFLDAEALVKGRHAFNSINEALTGVLVHVAIFSPGYAESKYCLNELCDMLASQKPLIPVFYDVEPENLRWTDVGPFAEAFQEHLRKGRDHDVLRWKKALLQAAAITGFKLVDCDNNTVKLEETIVAAVLDALPMPTPLAPARHPVGLKQSCTKVINMLHEMGENVGVVGICGMGGIGKTTLAKEVYNKEHSNFGSWCFLSDVKEAKGVAVMDLQMKIVSDLLHVDAKKMQWDSTRWFDLIRKHKRKVFLVIDDVSKRQQFDKLIPNVKELPPGSRVVITSRESSVLKNIMLDVPQSELYHVPELNFLDSLELFLWCAFQGNDIDLVDASFHNFVKDIARACCGLPLALEVMGGFLSDKKNFPEDERYWKEATLALRKNGDIITSLQISYDGLVEDEDKRMFLDIACFMIGHPQMLALEVWDSNGSYGSSSWSLGRLVDKCLVKVDDDRQLRMHDLLRDMGRNIVMHKAPYKPEMWSHIWDPSIAIKVLKKKQGSNEVLALSMIGENSGIACNAELYARMRELRYLLLDKCPVNGDFSDWPEELRWLQWRYFPYEELPSSLNLPNLAVLDLASSKCLTSIWAKDFKVEIPYAELRVLILSMCTELRELPQHITKLVKLKFVDLGGCCSLSSLPDSLGDLTELDYLNLWGCRLLKYLPDSIVNLVKLRELCVGYSGLKRLPMEFGRLKSLAIFKAMEIDLEELPNSFGRLQGLKEANFGSCLKLWNLSENFGCLKDLQVLKLSGCVSLSVLQDSFSNLSNLQELNLSNCKLFEKLPYSMDKLKKLRLLCMESTVIKELPEDFGQLHCLTEVDFENCKHLQSLSANFGCLGSLQTLNINGCKSLMKLPDSFHDLSNLEDLYMNGCELFEKFPPSIAKLKKLRVLCMGSMVIKELPNDFGQLQSLTKVKFEDCKHLQTLCENFGCLPSLRKLDLGGCSSLSKLPDSFSNLSDLEKLNLSHSKLDQKLLLPIYNLKKLQILKMRSMDFEELPKNLIQLQSLTKVDLSCCKQLCHLCEDFGYLGNLQNVNLEGCRSLTKLPNSFSNLTNLEVLNLNGCDQLEKLPPLCKFTKLRVLEMRYTALKIMPQDFGQFQSLIEADFGHSAQLQVLCENFGNLGSLTGLSFKSCRGLTKLPDSFSNLSNLVNLDLRGCALLETLPSSVNGLKKLEYLDMTNMTLEELPEDFGQLQSLIKLDLHNCNRLQTLCTNFGCLGKLFGLYLGSCESLTKLPDSFSDLFSLEILELNWCKVLKKLPPSISRLKKLRILRMGSTALEELPDDFGQLHSLTDIDFNDCKRLEALCENFGCLRRLQKLNLMFCESLKKLPDSFSDLSNLSELNLYGCKVLQKLPPSVYGLKKLSILHMGSTLLEELPEDFGQLQSLTKVDLRNCKQLQDLCENFGSLGSLQKLNLDGCERLMKLPTSFSYLSNLKKLRMFGCKHIKKLPTSICKLKNLRVTPEEYIWHKKNS